MLRENITIGVFFEMSRLVLDGDMLVTQLSPHGDDLCEPFNCVVPLHNSCRHDGDILRDQSCIEAIVLGQDAAGAGELTFARTRSAVLCTVQSGLMGLGRIAPLGRRGLGRSAARRHEKQRWGRPTAGEAAAGISQIG